MIRTLLAIALLGLTTTSGQADETASSPPKGHESGKRISLFDGKSLTGWEIQGQGKWVAVDGAIRGTKKASEHSWGHLVSKRQFDDCRIRLKYKVTQANSGVYVRSEIGGKFGVHGMQIDVGGMKDALPMGVTKALYRWLPVTVHNKTGAKYGEWNLLEIETRGQRLRTWLNGKLRVDEEITVEMMPRTGRISFQLHAGQQANEVFFKDIEVFISDSKVH